MSKKKDADDSPKQHYSVDHFVKTLKILLWHRKYNESSYKFHLKSSCTIEACLTAQVVFQFAAKYFEVMYYFKLFDLI